MNVSVDGYWYWPGTFQSVDNVCPWASILLICCRAMSGPSDTGGIDYLQAPSPPWHKVCTAAGGWQSQHIFIQLTIDSKICQLSTSHLGQQSYNRPLPMLENNFMIHVSTHFTVPLYYIIFFSNNYKSRILHKSRSDESSHDGRSGELREISQVEEDNPRTLSTPRLCSHRRRRNPSMISS